MCTLSKSLMKAITSFWKAMISFLSQEAGAAAKKIHVSYSSCVRQAQKNMRRCKKDSANCSRIVSTSQLLRIHRNSVETTSSRVLADSGLRTGFPKRSSFGQSHRIDWAGNGKIFWKLDEKCRDFSKLVSITTDGASNMASQESWRTS